MVISQKKFRNVDDYISTFPSGVKKILQKVRQIIRGVMPKATETISYQIPTFKLNGKYVIYFAGWKNHISLYPIPSGTKSFNLSLLPYIAGRGTLKFLLKNPIPFDLIKKVVEYRMKENLKK